MLHYCLDTEGLTKGRIKMLHQNTTERRYDDFLNRIVDDIFMCSVNGCTSYKQTTSVKPTPKISINPKTLNQTDQRKSWVSLDNYQYYSSQACGVLDDASSLHQVNEA